MVDLEMEDRECLQGWLRESAKEDSLVARAVA
jgi:hypothetical protein